jgi:hypothetical protein
LFYLEKKMSPSRHIMKKKNIKKSPYLENRSQLLKNKLPSLDEES